MSVETNAERAARVARQNAERVEEMVRVPLQEIDKSTWPRHVRPIAISETGGLGLDPDGRLYWNGKPVEIVGSRIDLTWGQFWLAVIVALFTAIGGLGAAAQGWAAYHDWACKNKRPAIVACPSPEAPSIQE
jgi:hypothetical protein